MTVFTPQRTRFTTVLVKPEGTKGTDSTPSGASNAIRAENVKVAPKFLAVQTNEELGSLDGFGDLVGGATYDITFDSYFRGNTPVATAPDVSPLLKGSGLTETITAAAVPGAPEAAAAGSTTTLTLGATAVGTSELYRGMPLALTVNPAAGATAFIQDYTSGKLATLFDVFGSALDNTTQYQVLKNVLYAGSSALPAGQTVWVQHDGTLYKFVGCVVDWSLALATAKPGKFSFKVSGQFESKAYGQGSLSPVYDSILPPIWKGGVMLINGATALLKSFTLSIGNQVVFPENPNAADGYDPPLIVGRKWTASLDPLENASGTPDILADLRAGTLRPIHARLGSVAGNRCAISLYNARYLDQQPTDQQGLLANQVKVAVTGQDAAACSICIY